MERPSIEEILNEAVSSVVMLPNRARDVRPLAPFALLLSAIAIAFAAIAMATLAALTTAFFLFAAFGRDGLSDFMAEARFDPRRKAQLAALAVSALYLGVAMATLAAARLRAGRGPWSHFVAAGAGRWRVRGVFTLALATLGYGGVFTYSQVEWHERHLLTLGPTDYLLLGTLVANLVLLAPLAEELFFRGWLYTALRARWGVLPAFLVTAASFAAIHWDPAHRHMFRVLPLALAVGLLREITGSIRPTMVLHAAYNAVIVAITLAAA